MNQDQETRLDELNLLANWASTINDRETRLMLAEYVLERTKKIVSEEEQ
jgi:hypothetical protein